MSDIPNEIQSLADAYSAKIKDLTNSYMENCLQLHKDGPPSPELAEPTTLSWPLYPWWNIFLIGPIQYVGPPHVGPFMPSKIISHKNRAFMVACVWRNPGPIGWSLGSPSACQVMNGRKFQINFEVVDLTNVSGGPDLEKVEDTFHNAPDCLQCYVREIKNFPEPDQGRPNLYNLYATIDITEAEQPMAGFATWVLDLDSEPHWMWFPRVRPEWQYDQPAQFMVYKR